MLHPNKVIKSKLAKPLEAAVTITKIKIMGKMFKTVVSVVVFKYHF